MVICQNREMWTTEDFEYEAAVLAQCEREDECDASDVRSGLCRWAEWPSEREVAQDAAVSDEQVSGHGSADCYRPDDEPSAFHVRPGEGSLCASQWDGRLTPAERRINNM